MRLTFVWSGALAILLALAPAADAQNVTPGSRKIVTLSPCSYDIMTTAVWPEIAARKEHYLWDDLRDPNNDNIPVLTVPMLNMLCHQGYGVFYFDTHGNPFVLVVEPYSTYGAQQSRLSTLWSQGYSDQEVVEANILDQTTGAVRIYGIGATKQFFQNRFVNNNTVVMILACNAWGFQDAFPSKLAYVAADFDHSYNDIIGDVQELHENLLGWHGRSCRPLGPAILGTQLSLAGATNVVLAPSVTNITVGGSELVNGDFHGPVTATVHFDTPMSTLPPASQIVSGSGSIDVASATWTNSTSITFNASCNRLGSGAIVINPDSTTRNCCGARSSPANIALDGNADGDWPGISGYAPNDDPYTVNLNSTAEEDPWALISGFTVTRGSSGLTAQWLVDVEIGSAKYLIEGSPNRSGPFSVLATVEATRASSYAVPLGFAPDSWTYRIREVEADGDTLPHGYTSVAESSGNQVTAEATVSPEDEARLESYRQIYLAEEAARQSDGIESTENFEFNIVVPAAWKPRAQSYMGFLSTKGIHPGLIETIENLGASGIKAWFDALYDQGGKYSLLMADCNDDKDASGALFWTNLALWTKWFPHPTFPLQSSLNFIPRFRYYAIPDSQQYSMTWTTPYFGSDWGYIDRDNDSLPDPGRAIGRAPVSNDAEAANWVTKQINAWNLNPATSYLNHVGAWLYGQDDAVNKGSRATQLMNQMLLQIPTGLVVDRIFDNNPSAPMFPSERNTTAVAAVNQGRGLLITYGTISGARGQHWAGFFDLSNGFKADSLKANPQCLPFLLGLSCGIGNTDETENPIVGNPVVERLENLPDRGNTGSFAPSRCSWQVGNELIGNIWLDRVFHRGSRSLGMASAEAVYLAAKQYPEYKQLFMSYTYTGCPALRLANMVQSNVGVEEPTTQLALSAPWPNPVKHGSTTIGFRLAQAGPVSLQVFDLHGRLITTLANGLASVGSHHLNWSTAGVASGMYFIRLQAAGREFKQKVVVLQ